jgi:hypothetical protein
LAHFLRPATRGKTEGSFTVIVVWKKFSETDVFHQCKETHMNTGCSIYRLCKSFPYDGVPHECIYT